MILKSQIEQVINKQLEWLNSRHREINRMPVTDTPGFATVITGIRRCGKSTLMKQIMRQYPKSDTLYLNFDDIHLAGFDMDDFKRLYAIIEERRSRILFFDEFQIVSGWEVFAHQLLREGFRFYVTGSNASMLSVELGTHLTGRHLSYELFPFSYAEYTDYTKQSIGEKSFMKYLSEGGMPEYLASSNHQILQTVLDDILIRDIAIRHSIRNVEPLKRLAVYLLTNIAKPFSGNRLTSVVGTMATSTVLDYVDYMRDAYLIDTIGQYSSNIRATTRNPKKVYCVDNGLACSVSLSQSSDWERLLENHQFLQLRKEHKDHIYYYRGVGECDFVVTNMDNTPQQLYQVCLKLDDENMTREIGGLREAMRELHIKQGTIVTLSDEDNITVGEGVINITKAF